MGLCYCCSGISFEQCCEPVMKEKSAETAEALMRSCYSAYALAAVDYLLETTHISPGNYTRLLLSRAGLFPANG
jgi:SEC-C motif-containing protein